MIDTIMLSARLSKSAPKSLAGDGIHRDLVKKGRLGGRHAYEETVHGPGIRFSLCEEINECVVVLNPTRLMVPEPSANFPLRPFASIDDLDLPAAELWMARRMGYELTTASEAHQLLRLDRLPVTMIDYALDLDVGEDQLVAVLDALTKVRRKRRSNAHAWSNRQGRTNAVQFGEAKSDVRVLLYSKAEELLARVEPLKHRHGKDGERARALRAHLAEEARGTIRMEVRLRGVAAVRAVFDELSTEVCPTLRLMADRRVADYMLARELRRLGLLVLTSA